MKQFTSRIDFSITKKRLNMLSKKASKSSMLPKALFVIPVFSILTLMFCADSENPYENMNHIELSAINKSMYYDIELDTEGYVGLYHPKDERTGILLGPDGLPYNGKRSAFYSDTDSLFFTETIVDGKKTQMVMNMYDSTGTFSYQTLSEYSLDLNGNFVTISYANRQTDNLVLSDIKMDSDSLSTYVMYHPNGQIAQEFQIKPALGLDGIATIYDDKGIIIGQRLYDEGELVETVVKLEE